MNGTANIACQPDIYQPNTCRHSNDFCIIQIPNAKQLIWHIITLNEKDQGISFNVNEHHTYKDDSVRFEKISNGTITEYKPYRNLYIANVENATGHFIVRVEPYEP